MRRHVRRRAMMVRRTSRICVRWWVACDADAPVTFVSPHSHKRNR